METKNDRVSGFSTDHGFKNSSRGRIGDRGNTGYNTYRFRNLHIAFHVVFINNAYRLGIFDIMPNVFTGKHVLDDLVFHHSASGFLIGQLGERHMIVQTGQSHRMHDLIDLLLVQLHILFQSLLCVGHQLVNHSVNIDGWLFLIFLLTWHGK